MRADRGRVPRPAIRYRCRRGDEAGRASAARRSVHARRRPQADPSVQRRQSRRLLEGRHRRGLPRRRRHHRATLLERAGAPGLYRAACLRRIGRRRWSMHDLELEPGPVHGARLLREIARHRHFRHPRDPGRDRWWVRRQDPRLSRARRARAGQKDGAAGQDGHEPRGSLPRHRPGGGRCRRSQARREEGRTADRRRGRAQIPGRRLPGLARRARLHVRLCDVRHPECESHRLRCRVSNRPKVAAYRAPGAPNSSYGVESCLDELADQLGIDPLVVPRKERGQGRRQGRARPDLAEHRLRADRRSRQEPPASEGEARAQPGPRHRLRLLVQHRRRVRARPATSTRTALPSSCRATRTSAARAPRSG